MRARISRPTTVVRCSPWHRRTRMGVLGHQHLRADRGRTHRHPDRHGLAGIRLLVAGQSTGPPTLQLKRPSVRDSTGDATNDDTVTGLALPVPLVRETMGLQHLPPKGGDRDHASGCAEEPGHSSGRHHPDMPVLRKGSARYLRTEVPRELRNGPGLLILLPALSKSDGVRRPVVPVPWLTGIGTHTLRIGTSGARMRRRCEPP